ncbi:MAG: cytochrome c3 family protein [candidate division KSB1 bacterium]|nr:cytochrome c3 family protein [candidate division KSB1 bacterium]
MRLRTLLAWLTISSALTAGGVIAISGLANNSSWGDPIEQWASVKFSHKKHIVELGAECSTCHPSAQTSENSNDLLLPKQADCAVCHEQVENDCQYCHVDEKKYEPYAAPKREVLFNHKLHVETQQMECAACHAGVEQSETPSLAFLPVMASCNACHNNVRAASACESCHPQIEALRPLSHAQVDWAKEHKRLVRAEGASNDCAVCHMDNFCQTCHDEATTQLTSGNFIRSVPENRPTPSGKPALVKPNVHEPNYLLSHSLDLRAKKADCYSCHDQQRFCTDCHTRNQDAGFPAPFPLSHSAADFVRLGMGSGGGQHAVLARRDMESCASCHDVQGRDPVCVKCHVNLAPK